MEGIEIGKVLAEFVLAGVILWLSDRQIKLMQEQIEERDKRIERLETSLEKCNAEHQKDLRGWAGIEAWARRDAEEDTKRILNQEKRDRLRAEWDKHNGDSSSSA